MGGIKNKSEENKIAFLFILLPTIMLIVGYLLNTNPHPSEIVSYFIHILILVALILLSGAPFGITTLA